MAEADVTDDKRLVFDEPTVELLTTPPLNLAHEIFSSVADAAVSQTSGTFAAKDYEQWAEVKAMSPEERADMVGLIALRFARKYFNTEPHPYVEFSFGYIERAEVAMISELCRSKLPFTELHILALIHSCRSVHDMESLAPIKQTVTAIERFLETNPVSPLMKESLEGFRDQSAEQKDMLASKLLQQMEDQLSSILNDHA